MGWKLFASIECSGGPSLAVGWSTLLGPPMLGLKSIKLVLNNVLAKVAGDRKKRQSLGPTWSNWNSNDYQQISNYPKKERLTKTHSNHSKDIIFITTIKCQIISTNGPSVSYRSTIFSRPLTGLPFISRGIKVILEFFFKTKFGYKLICNLFATTH